MIDKWGDAHYINYSVQYEYVEQGEKMDFDISLYKITKIQNYSDPYSGL